MTLADRLDKIIDEQGLTKRAFAKTLGVSENYIYQLTGSQEKLTTIRLRFHGRLRIVIVHIQTACSRIAVSQDHPASRGGAAPADLWDEHNEVL